MVCWVIVILFTIQALEPHLAVAERNFKRVLSGSFQWGFHVWYSFPGTKL
jgi:hypothetical protein